MSSLSRRFITITVMATLGVWMFNPSNEGPPSITPGSPCDLHTANCGLSRKCLYLWLITAVIFSQVGNISLIIHAVCVAPDPHTYGQFLDLLTMISMISDLFLSFHLAIHSSHR